MGAIIIGRMKTVPEQAHAADPAVEQERQPHAQHHLDRHHRGREDEGDAQALVEVGVAQEPREVAQAHEVGLADALGGRPFEKARPGHVADRDRAARPPSRRARARGTAAASPGWPASAAPGAAARGRGGPAVWPTGAGPPMAAPRSAGARAGAVPRPGALGPGHQGLIPEVMPLADPAEAVRPGPDAGRSGVEDTGGRACATTESRTVHPRRAHPRLVGGETVRRDPRRPPFGSPETPGDAGPDMGATRARRPGRSAGGRGIAPPHR